MEKRYENQLFAGDSYVILYQYMQAGREMYIIYFWLVRYVFVVSYLCLSYVLVMS